MQEQQAKAQPTAARPRKRRYHHGVRYLTVSGVPMNPTVPVFWKATTGVTVKVQPVTVLGRPRWQASVVHAVHGRHIELVDGPPYHRRRTAVRAARRRHPVQE